MDSLIETFHIDLKLLLAQAINFAIVLAVLYYLILKPIMKTMGERTSKIEKSLADAERIEKELKKTEVDRKEVLARAKKEANDIMEKTAAMAEEKKKEMINKAREEIGVIINKEKEKMQFEKEITLKEIRKEIGELVVLAVEKVLNKKVDSREDKELIEKMVKETKGIINN
ncbi:MAG: F0F1 ATP synthase subunit B [Patescibacteria group bacterium]|jgi:F-type H+-transporting ATPase subunit b